MMVNNVYAHSSHAYDASTNGTGNSGSNTTSASMNGLDPNDFMMLLVAEIQNQDPTRPMDPTAFMSQLVDLNQLEQVMQINQKIQGFSTTATTSGAAPTSK
jgi:flagellar basal-body rod modification protein FlgD